MIVCIGCLHRLGGMTRRTRYDIARPTRRSINSFASSADSNTMVGWSQTVSYRKPTTLVCSADMLDDLERRSRSGPIA